VDFRPLEDRSDVLVYTSDPMGEGFEFGGAVSLVLKVSSSAKDTDFSAVLLEVDDQGRAINITRGIARARYREGLDRKVWMSPGGIYTLAIDLWFVSIRIPKGHRLRLHISSSQFPFFDRNLNTGGDNYTETRWVAAQNQVHHTNLHASYLSLPRRTDVGGSLASRLNTRSAAA
jgi:putative CocE/NonD family hydrolase